MASTYPKTGTNLDSTIHTSLSTQIVILVNNEPVGAIQSFGDKQSRGLVRITEVGTDGTIEIVPNKAAEVSLDLKRIMFDGLSITEALSRGFLNIKSQRIPFDIVVVDEFSGTDNDAIITTYKGCWFTSIGKTYNTGDFVIVQDASIWVEDVSSVRANEAVANSQGVGGGRQIAGVQLDDIEAGADTGNTRGTMDFPGLINAAF